MPPRYSYWTIIFGDQPTAFRSQTREELLPTLTQIRTRHPDAVMLWFARGRLWQSPEEAREAALRRRQAPTDKRARTGEVRDPKWRPGGAHRDPKDRDKPPRDVRRQRFAAQLRRDRIAPRPPRPRTPPKKKDEG